MENLPEDYHIKVGAQEGKRRLDIFLHQRFPQFSRSFIQKIIHQGKVVVGKKLMQKPSYILKSGDEIDITIPHVEEEFPSAESLPVHILFEDDFLLVLNKAGGMTTHPVHPQQRGTLVNALLYHTKRLSGVGGILRPGIVHRLDKETSGVMLVAKTDPAHIALSCQFKKREIKKRYLALVKGKPSLCEGTVELEIGRHPIYRTKMVSGGECAREALTSYKLLKSWKNWSLLEVYPLTGRTHQIRVHLKSLNCHLVGDRLYGGKPGRDFPLPVSRCMLHSKFIGFFHPEEKKWMEFEAPLPPDMKEIINYLEREYAVK
ncbi:RluA family pseudouridine synthase [Candidatus Aerophobetes bacterium]|nr:RluA family pseudouridine synthase [Candidatus Aerophobetes bacterium]